MRTTYRVLAYLIALEVVVQAAALALGFAGLVHWVDGGGVVDSGVVESDSDPFPEVVGLVVHGINGLTNGALDDAETKARALARAAELGFLVKR